MATATMRRDVRIDAARGVLIIGMVIYHVIWDLAALGLIDPAEASKPGFRRLGATIAGGFLTVSGMSLYLMRHSTTDEAQFWAKFRKRLGIIVGAAVLVSLGTWLAMGDRFVRFGILHCIALSSVLALPFLRWPQWAAIAAAAVLIAMPHLVDAPVFAQAPLIWLGLSSSTPAMVDYVPMFPFAGMALLGVAAGPAVLARLGQPQDQAGADGWLARLGRWSLPIYLIHQPVLYGALFVLAGALNTAPPRAPVDRPDADTVGFRTECRKSCEANNNGKALCDRYCTCSETEMKQRGLWTRIMAGPAPSGAPPELEPLMRSCAAKAREQN